MTIVDQLIDPAALDGMLLLIERDISQFHAASNRPVAERDEALLFRIDVLATLMQQALTNHVAAHPDDRERVSRASQVVARRMLALRQSVEAPSADQPPEEERRAMRVRLALATLAEYVRVIPKMLAIWTVDDIDSQVADLLEPCLVDWREHADEAARIRHHAVFELMQLRAKVQARAGIDIPGLPLKLRYDREAADGLAGFGLAPQLADTVVRRIRQGKVPHLTFRD